MNKPDKIQPSIILISTTQKYKLVRKILFIENNTVLLWCNPFFFLSVYTEYLPTTTFVLTRQTNNNNNNRDMYNKEEITILLTDKGAKLEI